MEPIAGMFPTNSYVNIDAEVFSFATHGYWGNLLPTKRRYNQRIFLNPPNGLVKGTNV